MDNPRQSQPVMDIKPAAPSYQPVSNIPVHQPDAATVPANPMQPAPVTDSSAQNDGNLDQILQEVNREVAKTDSTSHKPKRFSLFRPKKGQAKPAQTVDSQVAKKTHGPKVYLHEVVAVLAAACLILLAWEAYKK